MTTPKCPLECEQNPHIRKGGLRRSILPLLQPPASPSPCETSVSWCSGISRATGQASASIRTRALRLARDEGLSLVWVPRAELIVQLLEAPDATTRRELLTAHADDVIADYAEVADSVDHEALRESAGEVSVRVYRIGVLIEAAVPGTPLGGGGGGSCECQI
jgi:hypothetical protein